MRSITRRLWAALGLGLIVEAVLLWPLNDSGHWYLVLLAAFGSWYIIISLQPGDSK